MSIPVRDLTGCARNGLGAQLFGNRYRSILWRWYGLVVTVVGLYKDSGVSRRIASPLTFPEIRHVLPSTTHYTYYDRFKRLKSQGLGLS